VNEVCRFKFDGISLHGEILSDPKDPNQPKVRSSMSIGLKDKFLYAFGGQDDDSGKLSDMWEFNMETRAWT